MTTVKQIHDYIEEIKIFIKENKDYTNEDIMNKLKIGYEMIEEIPSPSMRKKMGDKLYALIGFY